MDTSKHVKAYVKCGKNDAADAEALCEAMSRPTMQLTNAIRGYAAEFGLIAARGIDKIEPRLARLQDEPTLPALARELFAWHAKEYAQLQTQLKAVDAKLMAWHRQ